VKLKLPATTKPKQDSWAVTEQIDVSNFKDLVPNPALEVFIHIL